MSDLLKGDKDKARAHDMHFLQDLLAFHKDVEATFSTDHGFRVLVGLANERYLYDTLIGKTSATTNANVGVRDYIQAEIVDLVAVAAPEIHAKLMAQRSNKLGKQLQDALDSVRRDEP